MRGLCFGGDYNPEQWPETIWAEDIALMRRAGVNLVSVGVFAWASIEPQPGKYDFAWLDRVLDLLDAGGIRVALATPTASPPPWFSLAHPEALPVTSDGVRLLHGSRDTYCVAAPAYREASLRIASTLAARYADHPALAMWHVHNEYGTGCRCDLVAAAFRDWLRGRYQGLEALNAAWVTAFWGQRYGAWEEIFPPRATQYLVNPAQALDFRRFLSAELFAAFAEQRAVLREVTPDVPVTTNFVFGDWVPVDHRRWAQDLDLVAIDHYPFVPPGSDPAGTAVAEQTAFHADLARSWAGGRPWLLMEQSAGTVNTGLRLVSKAPGEMTRNSISHLARGSRGAMFFQWRASRGGSEQYHSALVPHAGPDSRIFREAVALGGLMGRLAQVDGAAVEAPVAILWDAEAWWGLLGPGLPAPEPRYVDALYAAHRALWRSGITADFVAPEADLSGYRLVLVPSLYLVSDQGAESVRRYVDGGGHLMVWYFSGIVDVNAQVRLGGYPGAFREVLGVRVEEFHPLAPEAPVTLTSGATGRTWSEHVHLAGAEAVDHYAAGPLGGLPAVTRAAYGAGVAWYLSTGLDDADLGKLICSVLRLAGVTPPAPGPTAGVEVVHRTAGDTRWLFAINHGDQPYDLQLSGTGLSGATDLVTGAMVGAVAIVPAGGFVVLRGDVAARDVGSGLRQASARS